MKRSNFDRILSPVLTAALMISALGVRATAQSREKLSPDQIGKIETLVTALKAKLGIPAISVAVLSGDRIVFERAYGIVDLENSIPAKNDSVFRIASTSKPITAVAVMQLAESGKLDLDAPVQKYAPAFPVKQFPVTTRKLLGHLSGVRHYKQGEGEYTTRFENLTSSLSVFKDDPLLHEPGSRYTYTTFGYTLLGVIIEGASGMSYADYMRERVFKPAGMNHTAIDDLYALIPGRVRGYRPRVYAKFDGYVRNADLMDSSYKIPGGGLVSTAADLARFALAVQNGVLIKKVTFEQMAIAQKISDGTSTPYGLGWYIEGMAGRTGVVRHGGVQPGFTANLYLMPHKQFAVGVLTNLEGGGRLGLDELAGQIADIVIP